MVYKCKSQNWRFWNRNDSINRLTSLYEFYSRMINPYSILWKNKTRTFCFIYPLTKKEINQVRSESINKRINLIQRKQTHINFLSKEIHYKKVEEQFLENKVQKIIKEIQDIFQKEICSDLPNAFWSRKKHKISLPYIQIFDESKIPTKARPIQMNEKLLEYCKQEIDSLIKKKLIRPSKSHWSCAVFYIQNVVELERGTPKLVINYKHLNKVLQWIRYPITNKQNLLKNFIVL